MLLTRLLMPFAVASLIAVSAGATANAQIAPPSPAPDTKSASPQNTPSPAAPLAPAPALPPPAPFEQALLNAATDLFTKVKMPDGAPMPSQLVIDPLIDGMTGIQSVATRSMERRIIDIVKKSYTNFSVQPFTTAAVAKSPVVLVGTFTPISLKTDGPRDAFRVCLALLDLKSGKIVSKGFARATMEGIDHTPVAYFNDSPVWTNDPATVAYIKSCQGTKAGDPISQAYADRVLSAAFLSDAINAYEDKRYGESLELYKTALTTPGGDQLRAYNGMYLANLKLKRKQPAAEAFAKVIDYGLANEKLAVKFLFKPGSNQLWSDSKTKTPYTMWLKTIAEKAAARNACLEIVGHSSSTGPEPINLRLSALRAEYIKDRLESSVSGLSKRLISHGVGSKEPLIGIGSDDARDALDRRVEFKSLGKC
ncbi:MAG: OmpA family protein [Hyphomicrobiaceae bacterium]